jgi:hypothetical protein
MQVILDKAIEDYRRRCFLEEVNKAYAALRQNPGAWAEVEKERTEWDGTLADGLPSDEQWNEKGAVVRKGARKAKRG